jgi:ethanolamine utilization cobalamin adenosyltransferase
MEEAVELIFGLVAVGLLLFGVSYMISMNHENSKASLNDRAITTLNDECTSACNERGDNSKIAMIELASDSLLFTKDNRVCYRAGLETMRCRICPCNVTVKDILDLTGEDVEDDGPFRYKCQITKIQDLETLRSNITINCTF